MSNARAAMSIQDAPDGPGLLTPSDDGKFMMWDNAAGRMIMATVRASGVAGAVLRTGNGSLQSAPDGPGVMAAGNDGMALLWDNDAGRFVATAVEAAGAVAAHVAEADPHTGYLLATGARTGASSQAQTFTNGIVSGVASTFNNHNPMLVGQTISYGFQADSYMSGIGGGSQNIFRRAGGTLASPTATLSGMSLGAFSFRGHTGSAFTTSRAIITVTAAEDWTSTANGTNMFFQTVPNGSTALANRLVILNDGNVGIGLSSPTAALHVSASTTARASVCKPHGSAPTSPVNGDEWTTTSGSFVRINGTTKTYVTVSSPATYTPSNVTTDRTYDANATTLDELADIVGTLIADLKLTGIIL